MESSLCKIILWYYIISIVMLANDAFFTWVGIRIGLPFWRQLIFLIGLYVIYKFIGKKRYKFPYIKNILSNYKNIFIIVFFLSIITVVFDGFSLLRIGYSWWNYFCGLPFLLFPFYCKKNHWSDRKFNMFFIVLGTFLSIGLLTDYLSGGFFTTMFLFSVTGNEVSFESGRFTFLSTAPTIFTVYYCFCLFCCFYEFQNTPAKGKRILLLILSGFFVLCSIFSGSRQTLAALIFLEFIGFINIFKYSKLVVFYILIAFVSYSVLVQNFSDLLVNNQGFQDRYTREAIEEDNRIHVWNLGLKECLIEPLSLRRILIGDGVGYTQGNGSSITEKVGSHYENTFFARVSDVGWILALWSLLLPCYFIVKYRRKHRSKNLLYLGVIGVYMFISLISPNGTSPTTQMILFILLGKFLEDNNLEYYENV